MGNFDGDEFPYPRFLRVPFIFVPHGAPPPLEWMAAHPGYVTLPATFVPRAAPATPEPGHEAEPEPEPELESEPEPPPEPRQPRVRPPDFREIDAFHEREREGTALAMRLTTPQGRAAVARAGLAHLRAHKSDVRAALAAAKAAGAASHGGDASLPAPPCVPRP